MTRSPLESLRSHLPKLATVSKLLQRWGYQQAALAPCSACLHADASFPFALQEGQDYLAAMACAANYAWVNRSSMTFLVRQAFQKLFAQQADDLDMHVVYDVSHNIAKVAFLPFALSSLLQP